MRTINPRSKYGAPGTEQKTHSGFRQQIDNQDSDMVDKNTHKMKGPSGSKARH